MPSEEKRENENLIAIQNDIYLLSIIGEVEGHEALAERAKATKYEHILPNLAKAEDNKNIKGILILLNTVGGDVEAGLAIADYSFIVPSATMVIHPVRQNGMFIGVAQSYRNMEKTQDRITEFVSGHSRISQKRLEELMLDTKMLVKDVGTMLDGKEAVKEGLIDEVGGISRALQKLHELMEEPANS